MTAKVTASVVINAPMELVWEKTNDVAAWPDLYREYAKVEILQREGDLLRFRLTMHPDDSGKAHIWSAERVLDVANRTVRSKGLESHAFESMDMEWRYTEVDGGVEMTWSQEFHLFDRIPVPDEAMAARIGQTANAQLAHLKELIEKQASRTLA